MKSRLVNGKVCGGADYHPEYEVTVEHSSFFGIKTWVQKYRGNYAWDLYPQGFPADYDIQVWLTAQAQQFEWSKEEHQ